MPTIEGMNTGISTAAEICGGFSALARALRVSGPTVHEWNSRRRHVPAARCVQIEQATGGVVRRWDLRPDDWHRIWPEIVGAPGAPVVEPPREPQDAAV
jgi:DNA-binding transcriptional regulator YdaS (Cro superfamily)